MGSRIFLIRHGETEGTSGMQHISTTDQNLSTAGERQVELTREQYVGGGKLIDPKRVTRMKLKESVNIRYITPRRRDHQTCEILRLGVHQHQHFYDRNTKQTTTTAIPPATGDIAEATIQITPSLAEWDYGEYEGLTTNQIREKRQQEGLDKEGPWSIWEAGCPGGENPQQVSDRVDELIGEMIEVLKSTSASWPGGRLVPNVSSEPRDIVCIGSGQSLAALAMRWTGLPLRCGVRLLIETAGVAILGFEDDDLNQPAIILGRRPVAP
ncbi:hypothetical protein KXW98_001623 [Aspergillus fumigatus]|uniref:Phosphoglycerate mutase family protein n=1 Tax=Aspergillus fumigatus TaxID=746128 RepID=A0A229XVX6_ASPFM|nr:hypothetical protein CNMCM8714_007363 [Aspergillus fumigatus]KAF4265124.1 hypothetical protein CNMCM8057_000618 [Aspergillus fumigatus]KAF4269777.1 hypothetical protein CNMCM8812_001373 [Aspergillus fumigatus]KAF4281868.1 hypothetical protein CNMCM8689_000119 [Aspergillus fumigatus]KAF4291394.1 hypothetical protein CNMCM8686_008785 [Aspergillus fumigatus]